MSDGRAGGIAGASARPPWAAAGLAVAMVLAACGGSAASPATATAPAGRPVPGEGASASAGATPAASQHATPAPSAGATPAPSAGATPASSQGPRLLLLADAASAATLHLLGMPGGSFELATPDPSTVGVAALGDGSLVALTADGRAFGAPRGVAGLLAGAPWEPLDLSEQAPLPPGAVVFPGIAVSPAGTVLAAIARPPDVDGPAALLLVEPTRGRRQVLPLAGAAGAAPAWLDEQHVALLQRDLADRTYLAVLRTDGTIVDRLDLRALDVRTSGDGRTVVILGDGDRLLVGPTADVLAQRAAPPAGPTTPPGDRVRGGLALDRDGRHLAVVIDEGEAGPGRVAVYELGRDGWRPAGRLAVPSGVAGSVVAWLP